MQEAPNRLWIGRRGQPDQLLNRDPGLLAPGARPYTALPGGHSEGWPDAFKNTLGNIFEFIAEDRDPRTADGIQFPTFADGYRAAAISDAIIRSHGSGGSGRMLKLESYGIRRENLFRSSFVAIVATAMCFGVRAEIMDALASQFHLTNEQTGWIAGAAFWGFTVSMFVGGMLCDVLGMRWLIAWASSAMSAVCCSQSLPQGSARSMPGPWPSAWRMASLKPLAIH